ncbi:hypothetical protein RVR_6650 [Actinacidiphila reveromycinica]|uniref:Uncharacterized protein n=1 Tax=Actinacidiphila reveromycinica TaxID=659352 RepID=A0A7U3VQL3_9ACTN|nr:hypothetical protein RVR_6650 [Streptomyces sp. SN-593]
MRPDRVPPHRVVLAGRSDGAPDGDVQPSGGRGERCRRVRAGPRRTATTSTGSGRSRALWAPTAALGERFQEQPARLPASSSSRQSAGR